VSGQSFVLAYVGRFGGETVLVMPSLVRRILAEAALSPTAAVGAARTSNVIDFIEEEDT
jgi:hypothetical protein